MIRRLAMLAGVLASGPAPGASEPTIELLAEQCRTWLESPGSEPAAACESYVKGFLDGLRADARLSLSGEDETADESWSERAARTRLSRAQRARARLDHYCLPAPMPVGSIVESLVDYLETAAARSENSAAGALETTLRLHYRCD